MTAMDGRADAERARPRGTPPPVAVLMGGPSAEHDVSLVSGRAIAAGLRAQGHDLEGWLIGLDGAWWRLAERALDPAQPAERYDVPNDLAAAGPLSPSAALGELAAVSPRRIVFVALHGPFGEDGTVQALLESAGLVYTGAGVEPSAICMDKALFKRIASGLGMPTTAWRAIGARHFRQAPETAVDELRAFAAALPDRRLIVKPSRLGSSIGMSIVHRPDRPGELEAGLEQAFRYDDVAVVEAYLAAARELEASVVGNDASDTIVYGPGEVFPGHEFYDYEAKYQAGVSRTTDHPEISPTLRGEIRRISREIYLALGVTGFARVDFLVHEGSPYLSEINTIPGFTPISLFPVLCAEGGYDLGGIASRIVDLALARAAARPRRALTRADLP